MNTNVPQNHPAERFLLFDEDSNAKGDGSISDAGGVTNPNLATRIGEGGAPSLLTLL